MQGIELSRRFYQEIVAPFLHKELKGVPHAAALMGYGSELLGFDDEMSKDHNWGPRVQIILARDVFHRHAEDLITSFGQIAPAEYLGEPIGWRSRPHPPSGGPEAAGTLAHGLEVHTLEGLLEAHFGRPRISSPSLADWMGLPEQRLLAFTRGAVFHDADGRLTATRALFSYFPDDIWLYKIACQWRRIAEEQAFVGRAGLVGDDLGSRVIAARLVRDMMGLGFLLERRYAPYPKWFGSAFALLPIEPKLAPHLKSALVAESWQTRGEALAEGYLVLADVQNAKTPARFEARIGPYFERPFVTINADDAVAAARAAIQDEALRIKEVMGSIDQISDLTPMLVNPGMCRRVIHQTDAVPGGTGTDAGL